MRLQVGRFTKPASVRRFPHGQVDLLELDNVVIGRMTYQPGWRWSIDVKPIAGTDSCQVAHHGYVLSGRMAIEMDDGTEGEVGPGDVVALAPGHDAWTVGDEPCVMVDFGEYADYAKAH